MARFARIDFAGGGGSCLGLKMLGLDDTEVVGVEYETPMVNTLRANGFHAWHADVTSEAVRSYAWPPLWLYQASPSCQSFSLGGKGEGRKHIASMIEALRLVADGLTPQKALAEVADEALDGRTELSLEPMLVIRDRRPRFVTFEQVPPVLPLWGAYCEILREWGYSAWCGIISSETLGVPQTRKRAILMARDAAATSELGEVAPPPATHSRYYSHNPSKLDDGVLPWVSMGEALSRGMAVMRSNYGTGGDPAARGERTSEEPAPTVTSKIDRNKWLLQGNQKPGGVNYQQRHEDSPAQTVTSNGHSYKWILGDTRRSNGTLRDEGQPSATITGSIDNGNVRWIPEAPNGGDTSWTEDRPSPTVVGSFRPDIVASPGYRKAGDGPRQNQPGSVSVSVSVSEAALLQSFPADHEFVGTKSQAFLMVGNACPPLMMRAIYAALLGLDPTSPQGES